MSYDAPQLTAVPTGGQGELFIRVEGVLRPVALMALVDDLSEGGNWQPITTFPLPGLYRVSGFTDLTWYTLTAFHVNHDGAAISPAANPVKARPEFRLTSRAVELVRQDSQMYVPGRTNAFRSHVQAWPVRGISGSIFLYRRELFGEGAATRDVFVAVCKPGDMAYPEGAIGDSPYYRLDYVDLVDRAADHRDENWSALQSDADELVQALLFEDIYGQESTE